MNNVFIYKNDDYNHLDETINSIVENFKVLKNIKRGTKVVIKANLVSALAPEKNATTNYKLLASLTKLSCFAFMLTFLGKPPIA